MAHGVVVSHEAAVFVEKYNKNPNIKFNELLEEFKRALHCEKLYKCTNKSDGKIRNIGINNLRKLSVELNACSAYPVINGSDLKSAMLDLANKIEKKIEEEMEKVISDKEEKLASSNFYTFAKACESALKKDDNKDIATAIVDACEEYLKKSNKYQKFYIFRRTIKGRAAFVNTARRAFKKFKK